MQKITTVLIDMYGVILEESKGNFIPYTFAHFDDTEHERLIEQFKVKQLFSKASRGEINSDEFLSLLGYEDPQYHMKNYIENYLTLDSGFRSFADMYCDKYDFVLLSNDVAEWSLYITEYHQLNQYFKYKIISGDVKCCKPEKRIYEVALERIKGNAAECVFVDNSVKNLEATKDLGIHTILFNRDHEEYEGMKVNSFTELSQLLEHWLY